MKLCLWKLVFIKHIKNQFRILLSDVSPPCRPPSSSVSPSLSACEPSTRPPLPSFTLSTFNHPSFTLSTFDHPSFTFRVFICAPFLKMLISVFCGVYNFLTLDATECCALACTGVPWCVVMCSDVFWCALAWENLFGKQTAQGFAIRRNVTDVMQLATGGGGRKLLLIWTGNCW